MNGVYHNEPGEFIPCGENRLIIAWFIYSDNPGYKWEINIRLLEGDETNYFEFETDIRRDAGPLPKLIQGGWWYHNGPDQPSVPWCRIWDFDSISANPN